MRGQTGLDMGTCSRAGWGGLEGFWLLGTPGATPVSLGLPLVEIFGINVLMDPNSQSKHRNTINLKTTEMNPMDRLLD